MCPMFNDIGCTGDYQLCIKCAKLRALVRPSTDLVILQLGLGVEGESARAAGGVDLDPLVDDHDVVPQALLRGEPLPAAVAMVVERGVVHLALRPQVDHVVLLQFRHLHDLAASLAAHLRHRLLLGDALLVVRVEPQRVALLAAVGALDEGLHVALPRHVVNQAGREVLPLIALRAVELVHEVNRLLVDAPGIFPQQRLEADGASPLIFGST